MERGRKRPGTDQATPLSKPCEITKNQGLYEGF